jgi:chromo domain-containing protein 1
VRKGVVSFSLSSFLLFLFSVCIFIACIWSSLIISQGFNSKYANGWIIGFEDTTAAVNDMAQYLRERQLAALWYHPQEDVAVVLVAYAAGTSDWEFFDTNIPFPPAANLRVVARGFLPHVSTIRSAVAMESPTQSSQPTRDKQLQGKAATEAEFTERAPPEDVHMADVEPLPVDAGDIDIIAIFRDQFDITFDELSIANTDKKDNVARSFFLYFPEDVNAEYELVMHFLKQYNIVTFSNRLEGDWERFAGTMTTGTILVRVSASVLF